MKAMSAYYIKMCVRELILDFDHFFEQTKL